MTKTAIEAIMQIVESLGGSGSPETVVEALELLAAQIGEGGLDEYVERYLTEHPQVVADAVNAYLAEQGVELTMTVTDGDLTISLE